MSVCDGTEVKGRGGWEGGERAHVEHEFGESTNRCPGFWSHDISCDRSLAAASTRVSNSRVALQWQRIKSPKKEKCNTSNKVPLLCAAGVIMDYSTLPQLGINISSMSDWNYKTLENPKKMTI